jgi:hypothetical protein
MFSATSTDYKQFHQERVTAELKEIGLKKKPD